MPFGMVARGIWQYGQIMPNQADSVLTETQLAEAPRKGRGYITNEHTVRSHWVHVALGFGLHKGDEGHVILRPCGRITYACYR
jgi:hypothetical protein